MLDTHIAYTRFAIHDLEDQRITGRGALVDQVASQLSRQLTSPRALAEELERQPHRVPSGQPHPHWTIELTLLDVEETRPQHLPHLVRVHQRKLGGGRVIESQAHHATLDQ